MNYPKGNAFNQKNDGKFGFYIKKTKKVSGGFSIKFSYIPPFPVRKMPKKINTPSIRENIPLMYCTYLQHSPVHIWVYYPHPEGGRSCSTCSYKHCTHPPR